MKSIESALIDCKKVIDTMPINEMIVELSAIMKKHSFEDFRISDERLTSKTLLNAGRMTNFIYKVTGLNPNLLPKINTIETDHKVKDRMKAITDNGGELVFESMENSIFADNLTMIDSQMPVVIAQMLIGFYSEIANNCAALTKYVNRINPLSCNENFYRHKVKELLFAIALCMTSANPWNGIYDAFSGYIIVKTNGDILAYHLYNRNDFKNYLLNNTKLERGSTNMNDYGIMYEADNKIKIKLNLQIKFI